MIYKSLILLSIVSLFTSNFNLLYSQSDVITLDGYVIDLNYNYYFQPCNDSNKGVLMSLNGASFPIFTDHHLGTMFYKELDQYRTDNHKIYCKFGPYNHKLYEDYIYCYHGRITLASFDRKNNSNEFPCNARIIVQGREYSVGCFYTPNALRGFELSSKPK